MSRALPALPARHGRRLRTFAIAFGLVAPTTANAQEPAATVTAPAPAAPAPAAPAPAPPAPEAPALPRISWDEGTTTLSLDKAEIQLTNKIWALALAEMPGESTTLGLAEPNATPRPAGQSRASFKVRKAESTLEGWFWRKNIGYELELTYLNPDGILNHANLNWDIASNEAVQVKFGMFKVPFCRQELDSSEYLQFVNRSIVSGEYAQGEDVGIQVWGLLFDRRLDWRAGAFNGDGRGRAFNDNRNFQYNARITYMPFGYVKYSESDLETTDRPLLAVALDFEHNDRRGATPDVDARRITMGADLSFKWRGLSFIGEALVRDNKPERASGLEAYRTPGFFAQAGYFVYRRNGEIAVRYATFDPSDMADADRRSEMGIALNWFQYKHALKVQADFRRLEDQAVGPADFEARLQTVMIF